MAGTTELAHISRSSIAAVQWTYTGYRLALILFAALTLLLNGCASTPSQVHKILVNDRLVDVASSEVSILRAGVLTPAHPGAPLESGDLIRTGANAQAVLLLENGAVEVFVLENSEVQISSIIVKLGEVFVRIKKKLQQQFEVQSEYGVAGAEGTEFFVSVERGVNYRCVTLEGKVTVRSPAGAWPTTTVAAQEQFLLVARGTAPTETTLDRKTYNEFVERLNRLEKTYRPGAMELVVPELTGLTEAEARQVLRDMGLTVGEVTGRLTGRVAVGEVLSQDPLAGQRTKPNGVVTLAVEAEPTTVPNITGRPLQSALASLNRARLRQGQISQQITGRYTEGTVIRHQPGEGARVPVDSTVELWVEAKSTEVPQLVNLSLPSARRMLANAGLTLGNVTSRLVSRIRDDTVLEQSVAARQRVLPGSEVHLVVAELGITVPAVTGMSQAAAARALSAAGLRVGRSSALESRAKPGTVIDQSPRAGDFQRPGGSVDITLATSPQCRVPDVVNMSPSAARSAISRAGLNPVSGGSGQCRNDVVTAQKPAAGAALRCGSSVSYSTGVRLC